MGYLAVQARFHPYMERDNSSFHLAIRNGVVIVDDRVALQELQERAATKAREQALKGNVKGAQQALVGKFKEVNIQTEETEIEY